MAYPLKIGRLYAYAGGKVETKLLHSAGMIIWSIELSDEEAGPFLLARRLRRRASGLYTQPQLCALAAHI